MWHAFEKVMIQSWAFIFARSSGGIPWVKQKCNLYFSEMQIIENGWKTRRERWKKLFFWSNTFLMMIIVNLCICKLAVAIIMINIITIIVLITIIIIIVIITIRITLTKYKRSPPSNIYWLSHPFPSLLFCIFYIFRQMSNQLLAYFSLKKYMWNNIPSDVKSNFGIISLKNTWNNILSDIFQSSKLIFYQTIGVQNRW